MKQIYILLLLFIRINLVLSVDGYYKNKEFNMELEKIKEDMNWLDFGEKIKNGVHFYYYDKINECNEGFSGCWFFQQFSSYCGCSISNYNATLKFKKLSPIPKTCDSDTCTYSKETVKSQHESSTISVTLGLTILDKLNVQNSISKTLDNTLTITIKNELTQKKGEKCVILGGYFYWEISGNMQKLCSTHPITGEECHAPDNDHYQGNKNGIVVIKDSGFANCYKYNTFEKYENKNYIQNDEIIWKINENFFDNNIIKYNKEEL